MATLTRQQANTMLATGVEHDLRDIHAVHGLLEQQFEAAVRHHTATLTALAEQMTPLLDAMEARRQQRIKLVRALLGPRANMAQYIESLAPAAQSPLGAAWRELEALTQACKQSTLRNGSLLAEQHAIMERVLHGEEHTYAPR